MHSRGFAPLARADAEILILGSLPGRESLRRRQYYAQPRNAFWPIMGALADFAPDLEYAARIERLLRARIAVWDVCRAAFRAGSLDAAIVADSIEVNDFPRFYRAHPAIRLVCCNGATAELLYRRRVLPALDSRLGALPLKRLPSTSPAHAARSLADKRAAWRRALAAVLSS